MDAIEHIGLDRTESIGDDDSFSCNRCGERLEIPKYSGYHYCPNCGKEYLINRAGGQVTISFNEEHPRNSEEQLSSSSRDSSPFQSLFPVINEARIRRGIIFIGWLFFSVSVSIAVIGYSGLIAPIVWSIVVFGWALYAYIVARKRI